MHPAPLALFGDLGLQELMLVAVAAVIIFGKDLPQVAGQAFAKFQRVRKTLTHMWRETGIDDEIRRIQREVDRGVSRKDLNLPNLAKRALDAQVTKKTPVRPITPLPGEEEAVAQERNGDAAPVAEEAPAPVPEEIHQAAQVSPPAPSPESAPTPVAEPADPADSRPGG